MSIVRKALSMHSSYTFTTGSAVFDEQNLLSAAGWCQCWNWLSRRSFGIDQRARGSAVDSGEVRRGQPAGKLTSIVAGMMCGADSIDDANVLRAAAHRVQRGICPIDVGIFLREFTFGHTKQLAQWPASI
ncbi:hypothetical protein I553_0065 [Mycobacterium xenopi 4042]|uniref:Uncharacterized protein n=1 Tax=Mycobacterium xenopi 4042 TaxID=1299334 RepID=X8BJ44_MYCXE|nr:hypothetical protein I553_0065 [Mycobacterium xenopi 4042]